MVCGVLLEAVEVARVPVQPPTTLVSGVLRGPLVQPQHRVAAEVVRLQSAALTLVGVGCHSPSTTAQPSSTAAVAVVGVRPALGRTGVVTALLPAIVLGRQALLIVVVVAAVVARLVSPVLLEAAWGEAAS